MDTARGHGYSVYPVLSFGTAMKGYDGESVVAARGRLSRLRRLLRRGGVHHQLIVGAARVRVQRVGGALTDRRPHTAVRRLGVRRARQRPLEDAATVERLELVLEADRRVTHGRHAHEQRLLRRRRRGRKDG